MINLNKYSQFTVLEIQFRSVIILKRLSKTSPVGTGVQYKRSLGQLQKLTKRFESNYYLQFFLFNATKAYFSTLLTVKVRYFITNYMNFMLVFEHFESLKDLSF